MTQRNQIPKDAIACNACIDATKETGCIKCGGYRYIAEPTVCDGCGTKFWVRPGAYTSYAGKKWVSFDGLEITDNYLGDGGTVQRTCARCPKTPEDAA